METVDLGIKNVKIPVAKIQGKAPGKSLLITAGSDGDEYAGIEAAYRLIDKYRKGTFWGNLAIIPILNIPGFEAGISNNPLDGKYPKNIFPGRKEGSSSERLIYWLRENFLKGVDFWIDLHGGAKDEYLKPYLYLYETKKTKMNKIIHKLPNLLKSPKIVIRPPGSWSKPEELAKLGINYVITEAGCLGKREEKFIKLHMEWVEEIMGFLGMISKKDPKKNGKSRIYTNITIICANKEGIWYPLAPSVIASRQAKQSPEFKISKHQLLGIIKDLTGKPISVLKSPVNGEFLFGKTSIWCKKGEEVMEIAFN